MQDNVGNYITVEVPRATSPANKPPETASAKIFPEANAEATTACAACSTCFTDPVTRQTICFDYQIGDPINVNNLEYVEHMRVKLARKSLFRKTLMRASGL